MLVAFRTDSSVKIGTGHVMRCLNLAEELRNQGHECLFICRDYPGHMGYLIETNAFVLHLLPDEEPHVAVGGDNLYAEWLGVPWEVDAKQTIQAVSMLRVDWLIVDHYSLNAEWERELASFVGRIMVIDDLASRGHHADLLLDQNLHHHSIEESYRRQAGDRCELLLGCKYALLRPEYALLARGLPERDGLVSRVLVFVGGSDPFHLTEHYLDALDAKAFGHLCVDVVIGKNHPSPAQVQQLVKRRPRARLHTDLPSLAFLMVRADLMLGAGGTTNWERMCLGLNAVVVSVAINQDAINRELGAKNLLTFLGSADNLIIGNTRDTIQDLLDNPEYLKRQSREMRKIVDGGGTRRIAQVLREASL